MKEDIVTTPKTRFQRGFEKGRQAERKEELKFLKDLSVVMYTTLTEKERRMFKDLVEKRIKELKNKIEGDGE